MNINMVRLVLVGVVTNFIVTVCVKTHGRRFLKVCTLILLSLAAIHYCSSDIYVETLVVFLPYYSWIYIIFEFLFKQLKASEYVIRPGKTGLIYT